MNKTMILDLTNAYIQQAKLDETIAKNHNITYQSTRTSRILSLLVELGELCNETRCFKYWSNKGPSPKDVILEEYADALHFFLSLGVDLNTSKKVFEINKNDGLLNEQFLTAYKLVIDFVNNQDEMHYNVAFNYFLNLILSLGYDIKDIYDSYMKKLDINYQRQQNNY